MEYVYRYSCCSPPVFSSGSELDQGFRRGVKATSGKPLSWRGACLGINIPGALPSDRVAGHSPQQLHVFHTIALRLLLFVPTEPSLLLLCLLFPCMALLWPHAALTEITSCSDVLCQGCLYLDKVSAFWILLLELRDHKMRELHLRLWGLRGVLRGLCLWHSYPVQFLTSFLQGRQKPLNNSAV